MSLWWIELAIGPFAVASVPIIRWCLRRWPEDAGGDAQGQAPRDIQHFAAPTD
jgi:hypothetical protein